MTHKFHHRRHKSPPLSWPRSIQLPFSEPMFLWSILMLSCHILLILPCGCLRRGFPTRILYVLLVSYSLALYPALASCRYFGRKLKRRDNSEDLGANGRIILEWMLVKLGGKVRIRCIRLRMERPVAGSCEHGNEPSGSTKFLDYLNDCQLLKKFFAPWSQY
jgi:hypothetical protein